MDTIGQLIDRLSIIHLKQFFAVKAYAANDDDNPAAYARIEDLQRQQRAILERINHLLGTGFEEGVFPQMKQHKQGFNPKYADIFDGDVQTVGDAIAALVRSNIEMWHTQNEIMNFSDVAPERKDQVVDNCSRFNLERNHAMDAIDELLNRLYGRVKERDDEQSLH